jgi:hypothetical protein
MTLKDTSLRGPRHALTTPRSQQRNPRRLRPSILQSGNQRRTSAPAPDNHRPLPKRRTDAGPTFFDISGLGYGTQDNRSDTPFFRGPPPSSTHAPPDTDATPLAGPRSDALGNAWRTGLRYLSRLAGRNRPRDPEHDHTDT